MFAGEPILIKMHGPTGIVNLQQHAPRVVQSGSQAPQLSAALKATASEAAGSSPSTIVNLSKSARFAVSREADGSSVHTAAPTDLQSPSLRDLLSQYDFHNITPREMSNLAGELFRREEISLDVAGSFTSVEMNTVVEKDENEPLDLVAHIKRMLDVVGEVSRADPQANLSFAMSYYENSNQALSAIMSFVNSDREHILN